MGWLGARLCGTLVLMSWQGVNVGGKGDGWLGALEGGLATESWGGGLRGAWLLWAGDGRGAALLGRP